MMFSARSFTDLDDLISPTTRSIDFQDDYAVVAVSRIVRLAWTSLSPDASLLTNDPETDVKRFGRTWADSADRPPQNPDNDDITSYWRKTAIPYQYNHVFWDVSQFVKDVYNGGHMHPPCTEMFAINFEDGEKAQAEGPTAMPNARRTWDKNILLTWAYVGEGVKVRAMVEVKKGAAEGDENATEKEFAVLERERATEAWWVQKGKEVRFYVEGDVVEGKKGVAAVVVWCPLCEGDESGAHTKIREILGD